MKRTPYRLVWTAVLGLALLAAVLVWLRSRPVGRPPPVSSADQTVTTNLHLLVRVRPADSSDTAPYAKPVETSGTITIPPGQVVEIYAMDDGTFGDAEVAQLASDFAGVTRLRSLGLPSAVTDAGLAHLARLTGLQQLYLSRTEITDAGLAYLVGLPSLRVLHLNATHTTDAGLAYLAKLTSLQELKLWDTRITDAGLAHLAGLTSLEKLSLPHQSTDAGLAYLADLAGLQELDLSDTRITDAGLAHLAGLTSLRVLDVKYTLVTDAGLAHLAGLTSLEFVNANATGVTDAGVAGLKRSLPGVVVSRRWD